MSTLPQIPFEPTQSTVPPQTRTESDIPDGAIAIIGMSVRAAGIVNPQQLWDVVFRGASSLTTLQADADNDPPNFVPVTGTVPGYDLFDNRLFGIGPRDAALMDPQHRKFLECCWEAFEDAALLPATAGPVGVFAGSGMNTYLLNNIMQSPGLIDSLGMFTVRHTGNDKDFMATEVSYHLDFRGPSVNVQTACSSSLVAVHMAVQSLLAGECDTALAGGSTIEFPVGGYVHEPGGVVASDGVCRPFDASATGTVFTSGVGVVVLRRLDDAIRDHDPIYAVIRGSAVNNDGSGKVGFLAPSVDGHADVVVEALEVSGIEANDIGYLETHGTGTAIGDPIEIAALTAAFGADGSAGRCALGSTKANVGHADTAAGVIGLIKVVKAIEAGIIPPLAHFSRINPSIRLETSPFYVPTKAQPWTGVRRAGVSSLGVGGTNAHVVVEQFDGGERRRSAANVSSEALRILPIFGPNQDGVQRTAQAIAATLRHTPGSSNRVEHLDDLIATLQTRRELDHRSAIVIAPLADVSHRLTNRVRTTVSRHRRVTEIAFLLPGAGPQYAHMGSGLNQHLPEYQRVVTEADEVLRGRGFADIADALGRLEEVDLKRPSVALPALAVVEVGIAAVLAAVGIVPSYLVGNSMGELVAAHLGGSLSFADLIQLAAVRGQLLERFSEVGAASIVALGVEELRMLIDGSLSIAVHSATSHCVVSGFINDLEQLESKLESLGHSAQRLSIGSAPHSVVLDPVLNEWRNALAACTFKQPVTPWLSNVTGDWITDVDASSPDYWVRQFRETVQLKSCLERITAKCDVLVEVGPGVSFLALLRDYSSNTVVTTLRRPALTESSQQPHETGVQPVVDFELDSSESDFVLNAIEDLFGLTTMSASCSSGERLHAPGYVFEPARHFIEPLARPSDERRGKRRSEGRPLPRERWFSEMVWQRSGAVLSPGSAGLRADRWLVFSLNGKDAMTQALRRAGAEVTVVTPNVADLQTDADYSISPNIRSDFDRLWAKLVHTNRVPTKIIYLWSMRPVVPALIGTGSAQRFDQMLLDAYFPLLHLGAMLTVNSDEPIRLGVVTNGVFSVASQDVVEPLNALFVGPVNVLPREIQTLNVFGVDLALHTKLSDVADAVLSEAQGDVEGFVALRGQQRYVRRNVDLPMLGARSNAEIGAHAIPEFATIVVTGAFGGIGSALVRFLAKPGRRFVLVGRPFARHPSAYSGREQSLLTTVHALGATAVIEHADITSPSDVLALFERVRSRFGSPQVVLHLAGSIRDSLVVNKNGRDVNAVLRSKVLGGINLVNAAASFPEMRVVLFSSTSAFLGAPGQIDYASANAALDALAYANSDHSKVTTINWGPWRSVGMTQDPNSPNGAVLVGLVMSADHWWLDEHRPVDGTGVMPGMSMLALMVEALSNGPDHVSIHDLTIESAVAVPASSSVLVEVRAEPKTRQLKLWATIDDGVPFVAAHANPQPLRDSSSTDAPIIPELTGTEWLTTPIPSIESQRRHINFGSHWDIIERWRVTSQAAEAVLRADTLGASNWTALNPAALDIGIGVAMMSVQDRIDAALYVPVVLDRVSVLGTLEGDVTVRARPSTTAGGVQQGWMCLDVEYIVSGSVVIRIEGLQLRAIENASLLVEPNKSPATERPPILVLGDRSGIETTAGFEALETIIGHGFNGQIVVSSLPIDLLESVIRRQSSASTGLTVARPELPTEFLAPRTPEEATMQRIWCDALGLEVVGVHDDFFDIGGNSMVAIRLLSDVRRAFETRLPLSILLQSRTVEALTTQVLLLRAGSPVATATTVSTSSGPGMVSGLVEVINEPQAGSMEAELAPPSMREYDPIVTLRAGGDEPPLVLFHGAGGNVLVFTGLAQTCAPNHPIYGIQAAGTSISQQPDPTIEAMVDRYVQALHSRFGSRPMYLGGYSGGGVIALEVAERLTALGCEIRRVILLDTFHPLATESGRMRRVLNVATNVFAIGPKPVLRWVKTIIDWARGREAEDALDIGYGDPVEMGYRNLESHFGQIMEGYRTKRYKTPTTLIQVHEVKASLPFHYGWDKWIVNALQVLSTPGNHRTMLTQENVVELSRHIDQILWMN
jgi:acyl transferase domain-containing protein/thioesterase domain-containing protein